MMQQERNFSFTSQHLSSAGPVVDRTAKRLIGTLWMLAILTLAYLLAPIPAQASEDNVYEFTGQLSINGETIAKPQDVVVDGRESYVLIERDDKVIRITYSAQSAGDNVIDARFLIEQAQDETWQTLMQPSVQAVLGQQMSVSFSTDDGADNDDDIAEIHFLFTFYERS